MTVYFSLSAALLALTAGAHAEIQSWKRIPLGPSGFTIEVPADEGVFKRDVTIVHKDGGGSYGSDYTLTDWGPNMQWNDMIRVSYNQNWDESATGLDYLTKNVKTIPNFPPIQKRERGGRLVYEFGWRRKLAPKDPVSIEVNYIVELAKNRYLYLMFDCREASLDAYSAIYRHMRESLAPAAK